MKTKTEKLVCGITIFLILIEILLGGWSVDYILSWISKDIPFVFDIIIGFIAGTITIPIAIIGKILESFNVITLPFM